MTRQYASFRWESRWNQNKGVSATVSQSGSRIVLMTVMGSVSFDLASPHDDVESFAHMMVQAIEMLQRTKQQYDESMKDMENTR